MFVPQWDEILSGVVFYFILMYLLEICIYRFYFVKVHIFWEGHKIFAKSSPYFWLALHRTKVRWRFCKILRPSQNIWTTEKFLRNISWKDRYMKDRLLLRKDFTPWCCTLVRSLLIHTYVPLYWYTMKSKAFRGCIYLQFIYRVVYSLKL